MTGSLRSPAQVRSIRIIRRIAAICFVTMIVGVALLIYILGFDVHPHQVGFAVIVAACYVVFCGGGYGLVYRQQMRTARTL